MDTTRSAVITGIGVVSPIGVGVEAYQESIRQQRSGVRPITIYDTSCLPVRFGGEIVGFNSKLYIKPRKSIKVMCREIQAGFAAAAMAVEDSGLDPPNVDHDRFGVVFGADMFYGDVFELEDIYRNCTFDHQLDIERYGERIESDLYPLWMLKYLPNMVACHIGISYDARAHNNTIVLGEASSLVALIECASAIERGHADVMVTGGAGTRINLTPVVYRTDSNLSHRGDDPGSACRPFDADRDGMVNGEGAAAFLVESRAHAEARGARVLAEVCGCGRSFEAKTGSPLQRANAIRRSIALAFEDAQVKPHDIGHVNAHGVSTIEEDAIEAAAIHDLLRETPVTAPKSFFGNLGAGAGAVEMVASVMAMSTGDIPVTLNYTRPDPRCPVNVVHGVSQKDDKDAALILNQASMGQTVAVVLKRP